MREYRLAVATALATFVLLVVGGLVHATGSSLACPDWPLCYGRFFPPMVGGIFYEHGHRLVALLVAVLTVVLAVKVFRARRERSLRAHAAIAVALVVVQASLGAVTVLLRLPLLVSTAHLATSMAFFATIIWLALRLRPAAAAGPRAALAGIAALAVYAQIVLGAFVRHTGAGLACNVQIPLCDGVLWPAWGPGQIHMMHRILGLVVAALVVAAAVRPWRAARAAGAPGHAVIAAVGPALVVAQIALGFLTVTTYIDTAVVTLHLAAGALLLAQSLALFLIGTPGAAMARPGGLLAPGAA